MIVISLPLGALRDRLDDHATFSVIAAIVAAASIVGYLILKKDDEEADGDLFYRDGQVVA